MSLIIPVSEFKKQDADFEQILDFENVSVTIRLTYNTIVNYWFANFSAGDQSVLNVKITTNNLLLNQYKASISNIKGDFILQRITDDLINPELTYDNFGTDWVFVYLTENEVLEYKIENEII